MSYWAAPAGARAGSKVDPTRASGRVALALASLGALTVAACGPDILEARKVPITIVAGQPSVDQGGGTVEQRGAVNPGDFTETNPIQIDTFTQNATAKVDVLWMIDNSGSMAPKQAKIETDFQEFISALTTPVANQAAVDYHIGVITTDTYNPLQSGRLQNPGGLSSPWIGNTDTCKPPCDPVAQFQVLANVGTVGTGDEKGLLATLMALTPPLSTTAYNAAMPQLGGNLGFVRPDASLAIIEVSDEEDDSCSPINTDKEGCSESAIPTTAGGYGDIAYYSRAIAGLKGYGQQQLISLSAFVSNTQTATIPATGDGLTAGLLGCQVQGTPAGSTDPFDYAIYAPRYITVATNVSGANAVHSICDEDFSAAVDTISTYATLTSTFFLSRQPASASDVQVRVNQILQVAGTDYTYNATTNSVTFLNVPAAGDTIQISYKVNANAM